jgi:hypothetical protein
MKAFILKNILGIIGIVLGALTGYLYYQFVGCNSGSCSISSSPTNSTLYGALMGYLLLSLFEKDKKNRLKQKEQ